MLNFADLDECSDAGGEGVTAFLIRVISALNPSAYDRGAQTVSLGGPKWKCNGGYTSCAVLLLLKVHSVDLGNTF